MTNQSIFIPAGNETCKESIPVVNAMFLELLSLGVIVEQDLVARLYRQSVEKATESCHKILKMYSFGKLNPPLISYWESRSEFDWNDCLMKVHGYSLQANASNLADENYLPSLKDEIDLTNLKTLSLDSDQSALKQFEEYLDTTVVLDRKSFDKVIELAKTFFIAVQKPIKSNEVRIACLLGIQSVGISLKDAFEYLNCKSADVLRFAAGKRNIEYIKLPSDTLYATLPWKERVASLEFLDSRNFEQLCEDMALNRGAWDRYFTHMKLFSQKGFENRFTKVVAAALVSSGARHDVLNKGRVLNFINNESGVEQTLGGNLVYRTWASRVQSAIESKNFVHFQKEIELRPGMLFRNLGTYSHVCTPKTSHKFLELAASLISKVAPGPLLSLIQIDVDSKYRIIDSKGNTTIEDADYNPVIKDIQELCEGELRRRYSLEGKVEVDSELAQKVVPFLSTNSELDRGSIIPFEDSTYMYFLMHWVQNKIVTDLDHSFITINKDCTHGVVYFGRQVNSYITCSGDVRNAPAPHGGTEYGRISLKSIPPDVKYIVPICNVYCGELFSETQEAYAGFMFSESPEFNLANEHVRYELNKPAASNIPFVMDIVNKKLIILDYNNRIANGSTAHSSVSDVLKLIEAVKTRKFVTMERFAKMLSGAGSEVSLRISNEETDGTISPSRLFTLLE